MKRNDIFYSGVAENQNQNGSADEIDNEVQVSDIARFKIASRSKTDKAPHSSLTKILAVSFVFIFIVIVGAKYLQVQARVSKTRNELMMEKQQLRVYQSKEKSMQEEVKKLKQDIMRIRQENTEQAYNKPESNQPKKEINENEYFRVPKIVWLYLPNNITQQSYIVRLGFENIKHYAKLSQFQLRILTSSTYKTWFTEPVAKQIEEILNNVKANPIIASSIQTITQKLVSLYLMRQHGGVFIDRRLIFVQKLDWLGDIHKSVIVNRGNKITKPNYFAFFNMNSGPQWTAKQREVPNEVQRPVYVYPGITNNFLAGVPDGQFIKELLRVYTALIQTDATGRNYIINNNNIEKGQLNIMNNDHLLGLASHIVIKAKQTELDREQNGKYYQFAIDYYGLVTMNEYYSVDKMWVLFKNRLGTRNYFDNFYNFLAKLPQNQFQQVIGPMRFVINPDPYYEFNKRLQRASNHLNYQVWEGSFVHKHLYLGKAEDFIKPNHQKSVTPTVFKRWESLPKKVWMFWDSGIDNASAANQLCALNIIKNAKAAGFEVFKVDNNNLKDYLPQSEIARIDETIRQAKFQVQAQIRSDYIRLALIYAHGGIYMDVSYIWFQSFNWFVEVAKEPTHFIFNRFGEHPKVMMQFHTLEGAPFDWTVDRDANTKSSWHLAYENNLIVAEKENEFIREWYELFLKFTVSSFQDTEKKMIECRTNDMRWTSPYDRYLTAMDSLKAVIGCRQVLVENDPALYKNAADYYKIWSFNGFTGLQKFRYYNDYTFAYGGAINNDPEAIYRLSIDFNDATIGRVYKGIKMYSWNIRFLNAYLEKYHGNKFQKESHPNSYFHKYVYSKEEHEFYTTDKLHVRSKHN